MNLPTSVFGGGSMYLLRAKGDSMHDAGIDEGDLVVITAQNEANVGISLSRSTAAGRTRSSDMPALTRRAAAMCLNI